MKAKLTFQVTFDLRPATGPNRRGDKFEVVDCDGMRLFYTSDLDDAEDEVLSYCDPELTLNGKVVTEEDEPCLVDHDAILPGYGCSSCEFVS